MCEPATIAYIGMAVMAGATVYNGQVQQQIGKRNADVLEQKAAESRKMGAIQEEQKRIQTEQALGAQRAAAGASGVETEGGSYGLLYQDTATQGELDALTIRSNAAKGAWGYDQEAASSRYQGDAAAQGSLYGAAGTILQGAGQAWKMNSSGGGTGPGMTRLNGYKYGLIPLKP